jgi:hypothetical protein
MVNGMIVSSQLARWVQAKYDLLLERKIPYLDIGRQDVLDLRDVSARYAQASAVRRK